MEAHSRSLREAYADPNGLIYPETFKSFLYLLVWNDEINYGILRRGF